MRSSAVGDGSWAEVNVAGLVESDIRIAVVMYVAPTGDGDWPAGRPSPRSCNSIAEDIRRV